MLYCITDKEVSAGTLLPNRIILNKQAVFLIRMVISSF